MNLTAVSLFAGIEGIGLALHRAGIHVTAAVEIDDAARGVIADRLPDTALLTDVTKVTADDILATGFDPRRGVLAAGWPCQGNSVAGRRGGMADPRSGLWVHVARLLAELRPRWFLGENVPGLLSVNDGRDFATVVDDLAGLGYGFCWRVLDAKHFGVPQRRRRVFIVGRAGDRAAPVQVLLEPEGRGGDTAPRPTAGAGVAATLTGSSHHAGSNALGRRTEDDVNLAVVTTLQDGGRRGHRIDAEAAAGGHLVPFAVHENQRGEITTSDTAGALKTGGGKPGQGYPAVAYAVTSKWAKGNGGPAGDEAQNLVTHALTAEDADASEDGTGRGTPLTVMNGERNANAKEADARALLHRLWEALGTEDLREWCAGVATSLQPPSVLRSKVHEGGLPQEAEDLYGQLVNHAQAGATLEAGWAMRGLRQLEERGRPPHRWQLAEQHARELEAAMSRMPSTGALRVAVRRLTPLEAERLQGFPDGWTLTSNGKPQSDSARYRQLGNAVAVPCVEWIARRIAAVDGAA